MTHIDNRIWRLMWALALTPIVLQLVFLSLGFHARLGLGHWPTSITECNQSEALRAHEQFFKAFAFFTIWAAIPLWLMLVCIQRFRPSWSWKLPMLQAVVYAAGWGIVAVYAACDPCRFLEWYLD